MLGQVREAETAFNVREASSRREMERLAEFNAHLLKLLQSGSPGQAAAAAAAGVQGVAGVQQRGVHPSGAVAQPAWPGAQVPQQQPVQPPQPPPMARGAAPPTPAASFAYPPTMPSALQNVTLEVSCVATVVWRMCVVRSLTSPLCGVQAMMASLTEQTRNMQLLMATAVAPSASQSHALRGVQDGHDNPGQGTALSTACGPCMHAHGVDSHLV